MPTSNMPIKIYIAGPMTGKAEYNRPAFALAEKNLRAAGYRVINPAVMPTDLDREDYMPICLAMLERCDAIYLLDGWQESEGARVEVEYARYKDLLVLPLETAFEMDRSAVSYKVKCGDLNTENADEVITITITREEAECE